jgi:hypothetical protein
MHYPALPNKKVYSKINNNDCTYGKPQLNINTDKINA